MRFEQILSDLEKKIYKPIYFLHGEEEFFIDIVCDFISANVLSESEKEFNQSVLYGKDITASDIIDTARRFPMMANHQVLIVKEAQNIGDLDELTEYAKDPVKSTILVICHKHKAYDSRKALPKAIQKTGVVMKSDRLYDNKIPAWITDQLREKGYSITPEATRLLTASLGNDLVKIRMELGKLILNLEAGGTIDLDIIEENIGISKDFNVFNLQKAMAEGNMYSVNLICRHFAANPKTNPLPLTLAMLYQYFTKILILHSSKNKANNNALASELSISPFFVAEYKVAAKRFSIPKARHAIHLLREYDMKFKGLNNHSTNEGELLREMIFRIMH